MSFQQVRGAMAKLTSAALETGGVLIADQSFDNVEESPAKDAAGTYAAIFISFPQVVTEAIGCEGADLIVGSCNVVLYTPKRKGMKPAEDALQAVLKAWISMNKGATKYEGVYLGPRNISGPNPLASNESPHQVTQLSCAFSARVD